MPFVKESYKSSKMLEYLNSQQGLVDFTVLIRSLKQNLSSEAFPIVVFGGSYGGRKIRTPTHIIFHGSYVCELNPIFLLCKWNFLHLVIRI